MRQAHRTDPNRRQRQKGAIIVETALMVPVLIILLVAVVDLGLLIREHQILQNGAREGARLSSLPRNQVASWNPPATLATVQQRVVDYLAEEGITVAASDVTVDQGHLIGVGGNTVTGSEVTVTYNRDPLIGLILPGPVTLSAQAVFRNLY